MDALNTYLCKIFLSLVFIVLCFGSVMSQETGSDTSTVNEHKPEKSPLKATLFSAVIPGAGQVYNGGWHLVKVPVLYGGFGVLVYSINFNRENYRDFKTAYERAVNDLDHQYSDLNISDQGLKSQRDFYRKNLELSYIGMALLYIANVADAFVSAHLSSFDVNEDLSLRLKPYSEQTIAKETTTGFTVSLYF